MLITMDQKFILILVLLNLLLLVKTDFELNIIYLNDVHSHFFEINDNNQICTALNTTQGLCHGGIARQVTKIKEIRNKEKNVLVLSTGDLFLGDSSDSLRNWRLAVAMLPYLKINATSFGNHDFDSGGFDAAAYVVSLKWPIVCCNMVPNHNSVWETYVKKSIILDVGGKKIGIIGYIHPDSMKWSKSGMEYNYTEIIPCLQKEAAKLKKSNVSHIIALGNADHFTNKEIAKRVLGINIVVGGNSNIFLRNPINKNKLPFKPRTNYVKVVPKSPNSSYEVKDYFMSSDFSLVAEIPQQAKHLGHLKVIFSNEGSITNFSGAPIQLSNDIPKDPETENKLQENKALLVINKISDHINNTIIPKNNEVLDPETKLEKKGTSLSDKASDHKKNITIISKHDEVLGNSTIDLVGGHICRIQECTLGNFITDAVLYNCKSHVENFKRLPTNAAVWNSGGLLHTIPAGEIRISDLTNAIQLGDNVSIAKMNGSMLKNMMENSVFKYDWDGMMSSNKFLQVSGIRVTYDLNLPPGHRVTNITIQCVICNGTYTPLVDSDSYHIAMPLSIKLSDDWFKEHLTNNSIKTVLNTTLLGEFLKHKSPLTSGPEKRIILKTKEDINNLLNISRLFNFLNPDIIFLNKSSNEHKFVKSDFTTSPSSNNDLYRNNLDKKLVNNISTVKPYDNMMMSRIFGEIFVTPDKSPTPNATIINQRSKNKTKNVDVMSDSFNAPFLSQLFTNKFDQKYLNNPLHKIFQGKLDFDGLENDVVSSLNTMMNKNLPKYIINFDRLLLQHDANHKTVKKDLSHQDLSQPVTSDISIRQPDFDNWDIPEFDDWKWDLEEFKPINTLMVSDSNFGDNVRALALKNWLNLVDKPSTTSTINLASEQNQNSSLEDNDISIHRSDKQKPIHLNKPYDQFRRKNNSRNLTQFPFTSPNVSIHFYIFDIFNKKLNEKDHSEFQNLHNLIPNKMFQIKDILTEKSDDPMNRFLISWWKKSIFNKDNEHLKNEIFKKMWHNNASISHANNVTAFQNADIKNYTENTSIVNVNPLPQTLEHVKNISSLPHEKIKEEVRYTNKTINTLMSNDTFMKENNVTTLIIQSEILPYSNFSNFSEVNWKERFNDSEKLKINLYPHKENHVKSDTDPKNMKNVFNVSAANLSTSSSFSKFNDDNFTGKHMNFTYKQYHPYKRVKVIPSYGFPFKFWDVV